MHEITLHLELHRVHPPLGRDDDVSIVCAATVPGSQSGTRFHGFGLAFICNSGRRIPTLAFRSNSEKSDSSRGELAAALTAYEWLEQNRINNFCVKMYSGLEYVFKYLKPEIKKWITENNRANLDLLKKIAPKIDAFPDVEIQRLDKKGPLGPLQDAVLKAAGDAVLQGKQIEASEGAEFVGVEDDFDSRDLYARAMARDV